MKKVLIVEDQKILSDFLNRVIEENSFLELVGKSADGTSAIEDFEKYKPDIVLLDIGLPGLNGVEVLHRLKKIKSSTFVIVFTAHTETRIIQNAIRGGADSFLEKNVGLEELERALEMAVSGQPYYSTAAMLAMKEMILQPEKESLVDSLTAREKEVLQLIAESHTNKEISNKLGLSIGTVNTHRWNLMRKLNIHDATALTRFAIENGLTQSTGKNEF